VREALLPAGSPSAEEGELFGACARALPDQRQGFFVFFHNKLFSSWLFSL
jgi:hypothetical protein